MEREYLQKILEDFSESRMNTVYSEENYKDEKIEFSKRHQKKIKRLLWNEKYFGTHIRAGYVVRRVAMVGVVILSLVAANTVSAKVFGFDPWNTVIRSLGDVYEVKYEGPKEDAEEKETLGKRTEPVPVYVPEGYELVEKDGEMGEDVIAFWEKGEKGVIAYLGNFIQKNMNVLTDAEYDSRKKITVAGYEAYLVIDGEDMRIIWDDLKYQNTLQANAVSEEELIQMAESFYDIVQ
ncbi:MAG: DUF4367 domain-containing protein [Lachnospiraceae bacterium]|nr:DUF4367 domain-containing protein [Lachnospiraceae bacterium]